MNKLTKVRFLSLVETKANHRVWLSHTSSTHCLTIAFRNNSGSFADMEQRASQMPKASRIPEPGHILFTSRDELLVLLNPTGSLTRNKSAWRRAEATTPPAWACTGPVGTSQVINEILVFAQIRHGASVGEKAHQCFQWAFWWVYMKVTGKVTWMLEKTERWPRTPGSEHWFEDIISLWSGQTVLRPEPLRRKGKAIWWFSSVHSLSHVRLFVISWTAAHQASLSIINSQSLLKPKSIESVMPHNHFILCRPLLLLPSFFPSIRLFSNESVLRIRWPKYWSFSFSISPSNEYSVLISFRMGWLDLLAVQGAFKSLLQHHSSKASILRHSVFFILQLSHPYMTIGKTIASTRWTFVGKVISLLFNMLSRLIITFLSRSKRLLISRLQSLSAVILEPQKIVCHCFPIYFPWSDGTRCYDLCFLNVEL